MEENCSMIFKIFEYDKLNIINIITTIEELKKSVDELKVQNVYQDNDHDHNEIRRNRRRNNNRKKDYKYRKDSEDMYISKLKF